MANVSRPVVNKVMSSRKFYWTNRLIDLGMSQSMIMAGLSGAPHHASACAGTVRDVLLPWQVPSYSEIHLREGGKLVLLRQCCEFS